MNSYLKAMWYALIFDYNKTIDVFEEFNSDIQVEVCALCIVLMWAAIAFIIQIIISSI